MIWVFLFIIIYIVYALLRSNEKKQLKESLKDHEFRKSFIQNLIEEVFQNYLKMDLETVAKFKRELRDAQEKNDKNGIREANLQVKFFNDEISALKQIKRDLQKRGDPIWNHNNFSEEGLDELKEKISNDFSHSASHALLKIGSR